MERGKVEFGDPASSTVGTVHDEMRGVDEPFKARWMTPRGSPTVRILKSTRSDLGGIGVPFRALKIKGALTLVFDESWSRAKVKPEELWGLQRK